MPEYITTFSGSHFYPMHPEADVIHIRDIAHALPMICRGNGHVKVFYSVGQHCIHCAQEAEARGYSPRVILACLLHDAGECYMSDVPRPFKQFLPEYIEFEDRLLAVIYRKYLFTLPTPDEQRQIKAIDDDMLYYDLTVLLHEPASPEPPRLCSRISYEARTFESVTARYLALFYFYAAETALSFVQDNVSALSADTIISFRKLAAHSFLRASEKGHPDAIARLKQYSLE